MAAQATVRQPLPAWYRAILAVARLLTLVALALAVAPTASTAYADEEPSEPDTPVAVEASDDTPIKEVPVAEYLDVLASALPVVPQAADVEHAVRTATVKALNRADISVLDQTYDGTAQEPPVKVTMDGADLVQGEDYTVSYADNRDAGTARATIIGAGRYYGSATVTFAIERSSMLRAAITGLDGEYVEGDGAVEPDPVVTVDGREMKRDVDYVLTYEGNEGVGEASVTIQGKGNYTGARTQEFSIVPDTTAPVIDFPIMMVDRDHFNFADLSAALSTNKGKWKESDITWYIADGSVARFSTSSGLSTEATGSEVQVRGLSFGTTTITASLPNGYSDECTFKVISERTDSSVGRHYVHDGFTFYLVSGTWGNDFVEAYINNADRMVKKYPDYGTFGKEYPARNVYTAVQNDLKVWWPEGSSKFKVSGATHSYWGNITGDFTRRTMVKPEGELSPNDWLFLFTSKNQWGYLLHRENGIWHIAGDREGSAGYYSGKFNCYLGAVFKSEFGLAATYANNNSGSSLYHNLFHPGGGKGVPTSGGCIHMGTYASQLYYDTFTKAGAGTRVIAY